MPRLLTHELSNPLYLSLEVALVCFLVHAPYEERLYGNKSPSYWCHHGCIRNVSSAKCYP